MKIQSNVFFISVMILALITSPISFSGFVFAQEEPEDIGEFDNGIVDVSSYTSTDSNKVTLCHIPPGNPSKAHTITVDEHAVDTHLAHGDEIDSCSLEDIGEFDNGIVDVSSDTSTDSNKVTLCHIPPGNPSRAHTITVDEHAVDTHLAHGDEIDSCSLGQEVSNFVHESRDLFKQQKEETKTVIAQCREDTKNAEPSERKSAREQCKSNLKEIRESYKSLRETYRETFKEFRENIKVFIHESKGLPIDDSTRDAAIANIELLSDSAEKRELFRELQHKMNEEIREEKHKLREDLKKEREIAREELKSEREAIREALKSERENAREALKAENEMIREQEHKDREADREAMKEQREAEKETMKEQREAEKAQREADRETTNP